MEAFDAQLEGGRPRPLGGCFGETPAFVDELVKVRPTENETDGKVRPTESDTDGNRD